MKTRSFTIDSNIFLRSADRSSPDFETAKELLLSVASSEIIVMLSPQVIHECGVVLTRPREVNGFGLAPEEAYEFVAELTRLYKVRYETKRCFMTWLGLVKEHQIKWVKAHDARLVAWMINNDIERIITFNISDFEGLPVQPIHPAKVEI